MAEDQEVTKPVPVSLDELDASLVEDKIEINTDANPMEGPPPADDGIHRIKLVLDTQSWKRAKTKPGRDGSQKDYLACKYYGVIVDEDGNKNKRLFGQVNTLVFDGKSEMAYILLQIYGGKGNPHAVSYVKGLSNYVELAKAFGKALAGEPIIRAESQWSARYNAGTKEEPDYKTALSGQKNFPLNDPKDPTKGYRHIINVKGTGEVAANAVVKDFFPDVA